MDRLDNDSRNSELTEKSIRKSDDDIATISELNDYAERTGNLLVLLGGYATEALCGGKISRAHGDIDAHLIVYGNLPFDKIFSDVNEIIEKEETKWTLRGRNPEKVEYIEDTDAKEFFDKRRVEVTLHSSAKKHPRFIERQLVNSRGKIVNIHVPELQEIVCQKIYKFFSLKDGVDTSKDRHSSETDYVDLKKLLEIEGFKKELVIQPLVNSFENLGPVEAKEKACEAYNYTMSLLNNHQV